MHTRRFYVLRIDAVITDMRIGERHDLLAVTRVGQYFLVTSHGRVEHDLTDRLTSCANGNT